MPHNVCQGYIIILWQNIMLKRISVMLDDELIRKVRSEQARKLYNSEKSISFSQILNQVLRSGLKTMEK